MILSRGKNVGSKVLAPIFVLVPFLWMKSTLLSLPHLAVPPACYVKNKGRSCNDFIEELERDFDLRRESRQNYTRVVGVSNEVKRRYDLFEPEANCLSEERFGNERFASFGDGPKFVCGVNFIAEQKNTSKKPCLVYSVGSNNDISFETAVSKHLGCEIHTFDPTVSSEDFTGNDVATFHEWGLGRDGEAKNFHIGGRNGSYTSMSLKTMMNRLDHVGRKVDLLKIDCEGCEWQALPEIFDALYLKELEVDQIQIELHSGTKESIENFFTKVDEARMRILHKERNSWGCDGYRCLEYVFVSESFLKQAHKWQICNNRMLPAM